MTTPRPGHVVEVDALPQCMVCKRPAEWDCPILGETGWANLCRTHYREFAKYPGKTGVGLGQRLILRQQTSPEPDIIGGTMETPYVVIYLSLVANQDDSQGHLGCTAHGPFPTREKADAWNRDMRSVLGTGYIRPLVDPRDTYERLSAD